MSLAPAQNTRVRVSNACAALGVLLLLLAGVLPESWFPVAALFAGLALLALSHVLTPCQDQITRWWRRVLGKEAS